ncbi:three component ABC system middle component [Demequina sp. B12]|uniref:three component ABC system middle component n=1 Tax=Demequina sp. B12 TaxID=2992757 RepID=UPI0034E0D8FF
MTALLPWDTRPSLTATMINPALVGAAIAWCTARYHQETSHAMPWELCYLVPPLVLHRETRQGLAHVSKTHLSSWVGNHPAELVTFADRTRRFRPHVDEGLRFALRTEILAIADGHLLANIPTGTKVGANTELAEILRSSASLGRMLGRAGTSTNIYTIFGVSP